MFLNVSKVKATKTYKIQSVFQDFPDEFMKISTTHCIAILQLYGFLQKRFLVENHQNTSKHQKALGSRFQLLISYSSQTILRTINTDFVKKVTTAFLFSNIPLYKLNNKHIKNLFHNTGHSLPSEIICRKTMLQLSTDELQRTRNAVHDKQIFLVVEETTLSGIQYSNIIVGSRPVICSSTTCTTVNLYHMRQIATLLLKQLTLLLNLIKSTKTYSVFYCLMLHTIWWPET